MDGYVNNDTLVENPISLAVKNTVTCPLCQNIFIDPMICGCQNVYCKICIEDWSRTHKNCPNKCNNPIYQKCLGKMDILSKLKFKCLGCKKEILYNDAEIHHKACCPDKRISKLKQIPKKDLDSIKNEYKDDITLIKSKGKFILIIISIICSYNIGK